MDVTKEEQAAASASIVIASNNSGTLFYQNTDWKGSQFGFELNLLDEAMEVSIIFLNCSSSSAVFFSRTLNSVHQRPWFLLSQIACKAAAHVDGRLLNALKSLPLPKA